MSGNPGTASVPLAAACQQVGHQEQLCTISSSSVMTTVVVESTAHRVAHLTLEPEVVGTRSCTAFLPSPAANSPFSMPLASLVGALQHALPPAAVSEEDAALLARGQAPKHLKQQETIAHPPGGTNTRATEVVKVEASVTKVSMVTVVVPGDAAAAAAQGDACATSSPSCSAFEAALGPSAVSEPVAAAGGNCCKGRLPATVTSLASLAAANASQGSGQTAIPPHGVKAVCGKRAKMEDAFSVQCNFAELQMTTADTADYANKLPARIASQVGEQLEVVPAQLQPSVSPPTSMPLSPNSGAAASSCAASSLAHSESHEPSVTGSAATACSAASDSSSDASSGACCDTLHFFAVYDGHGGVEAAQHCSNRLHHHLLVALSTLAGANVQTQDAFCVANRTQGLDGAAATASVQCEAEWRLCPSPMGGTAPGGPERSVDSITAPPPGLAAMRAAVAASAEQQEQQEQQQEQQRGQQGQGSSNQGQQAVERLFSSSEGVDASAPATVAAAPSPLPSNAASGGHCSDGDAASNHSGGECTGTARSESAGNLCMTEALEQALRNAFLKTDEEFAEDGSSAMVGSTAVVALVGTKKMWIANCGDSRAVLCRGGRAIQVTDDHKPEREDEAERVEKAGGQVLYWNGHRVMGVLAMSRAIGDHGLRPYVIPEPEITVLSRVTDDDFLLMASDGLWDVMSNQEAITLAMRCLQRSYDKGTSRKAAVRVAATVLTRAALDRGSKDNVTVVIIDLKAPHTVSSSSPAPGGVQSCATADLAAVCASAEVCTSSDEPACCFAGLPASACADGNHPTHGAGSGGGSGGTAAADGGKRSLGSQQTLVSASAGLEEALALARSMVAAGGNSGGGASGAGEQRQQQGPCAC